MTRYRSGLLLFVCLALVLHAPPVRAQSAATTGAIEGTVLDESGGVLPGISAVSYTHLRAHETVLDLVCRLLLEKKNNQRYYAHHF